MEIEHYMKQIKLILNEGKTAIMVFKKEKSLTFNSKEFKTHSMKSTDECRYLSVILDKDLTFKKQLYNVNSKMASAIRSICFVRNQIPLNARINLF